MAGKEWSKMKYLLSQEEFDELIPRSECEALLDEKNRALGACFRLLKKFLNTPCHQNEILHKESGNKIEHEQGKGPFRCDYCPLNGADNTKGLLSEITSQQANEICTQTKFFSNQNPTK